MFRAQLPRPSIARTCLCGGRKAEGSGQAAGGAQTVFKKGYVSPYAFALVFAGLGNRGQAFAWLAKAYAARDTALPFLKVNPRLAPLRSAPRFYKLLRRIGLSA